jgi:hypothetical protein
LRTSIGPLILLSERDLKARDRRIVAEEFCYPKHHAYCPASTADYAIDYAKFFSRSHDAVIRVYDEAGNVIQTHEHKGDFKEA